MLDASGSMNDDVEQHAVHQRLRRELQVGAADAGASTRSSMETDTTVNWGLKFFADTDSTCGVGPTTSRCRSAPTTPARSPTRSRAHRRQRRRHQRQPHADPLGRKRGAAYLNTVTELEPEVHPARDRRPAELPPRQRQHRPGRLGRRGHVGCQRATAGFPTFVVGIATPAGGMADDDAQQHGERGRLSARGHAPLLPGDQRRGVRRGAADAGRHRRRPARSRCPTRRTATPIGRTSASKSTARRSAGPQPRERLGLHQHRHDRRADLRSELRRDHGGYASDVKIVFKCIIN